mmetsp:Transcript_33918/g.56057  ORF Transcript_33918/g.56057 Transcript_33918/m.56057 type:complete len:568 (+) Transcript_33918:39-1742(+)
MVPPSSCGEDVNLVKTPPGGSLSSESAAAVLQGLAGGVLLQLPPPVLQKESSAENVSRKDKSLGLLCDNFLQLFASGYSEVVELESVADRLGVGRRRIYDIVNVLESLEIVQKGKSSRYNWLGMSRLPMCIQQLESEWMRTGGKPSDVHLLLDSLNTAQEKENATDGTSIASSAGISSESSPAPTEGGDIGEREDKMGDREDKGRKEKSIRELSIKFIGLFMQATALPQLGGVLSLDHAARSLLVHERGGKEPDASAMKTKVRRLYDICNVLTSMAMLDKVKLPGTSKPAFKWLGVTEGTHSVFDSVAARSRTIKQYGGSDANKEVRRALTQQVGEARINPAAETAMVPFSSEVDARHGGVTAPTLAQAAKRAHEARDSSRRVAAKQEPAQPSTNSRDLLDATSKLSPATAISIPASSSLTTPSLFEKTEMMQGGSSTASVLSSSKTETVHARMLPRSVTERLQPPRHSRLATGKAIPIPTALPVDSIKGQFIPRSQSLLFIFSAPKVACASVDSEEEDVDEEDEEAGVRVGSAAALEPQSPQPPQLCTPGTATSALLSLAGYGLAY